MRIVSRIVKSRLPMALLLVLLSGCCGILSSESQRLPTLPPVTGPSIVTATPKTTRPASAAPAATVPTALPEAGAKKMIVSADGDGVYVRSKPDMAAKVRAWPDGSVMIVLGEEGDWYRVQAPNGYIGYIPKRFLALPRGSAPATPNPQPSATTPKAATPAP